MERSGKISAPAVSLPKGGGAISDIGETFQPNAFTGTADLSIPIATSPARSLTPQLSLTYSSGSGNGVFGLGVRLSIPNISRKTEKGIPRYDDTDIFVLSNAEELVPTLTQLVPPAAPAYTVLEYRPRVEGLFARIERWTRLADGDVHWQVVSKDNITNIYGRNESARIADPNDKKRVFSWLLEATIDAKGNKVVYTYKREDTAQVPRSIYETNRVSSANVYIHSIKYGNYLDTAKQEQWAFEIIFDYGEYDIAHIGQPNSDPYQPVRPWLARPDPFSSYRSGFEIRTYRLCRNILTFHRIADIGPKPCLVRATQLAYTLAGAITFLQSVVQTGFRLNADGSYAAQQLPPLELSYTTFAPSQQPFQPLTVEDGLPLPGYLDASGYQLIDLYGEGIASLLYADDTTRLYWEALGNGQFARPVELSQFPIAGDLRDRSQGAFLSLNGNGRQDLVIGDPARAGYYQSNADRSWDAFRPFDSFPLDYNAPGMELADLSGAGRADVVVFEDQLTTFYPSRGTHGFGAATLQVPDQQLAYVTANSAEEFVGFADMFGDGLSHRVRIRNGQVECWPSLGYGRFGPKVLFGNAPRFDSLLNTARLFLADLDGSGTTDLIYAYDDRVEVYFNQNGNAFSPPLSIRLPRAYSDLCQIEFADVRGNGTACMVLSMLEPDMRLTHLFYDFAGSQKPYLLQRYANNLGAETRISYTSSVEFYLGDKRASRRWATQLPFPVNVVERIEHVDQIAGSKLVRRYAYHDGYFDPVEREFRGFGYIESWDSEPFRLSPQPGAGPAASPGPPDERFFVQPAYTRTWYHVGDYQSNGALSRQYAHEYFSGDPQALSMADSVFDPAIDRIDAETIRQAYRALEGLVIREEIYGLAGPGAPDAGLAENPYSVSESNVYVRLLQPRLPHQYAVFYVHARETLAYDYELDPSDPRIQHDFTLRVDAFGNPLETCSVFYPRRTPAGSQLPIEQTTLKAMADVNSFINTTAGFYLIGAPRETQQFEIGGLKPAGAFYFTFDEVKTQVADALGNITQFETPLTAGALQARRLQWARSYYTAQTDPLPLGEITAQELLHHTEQAVFSQAQAATAFGGKVTSTILKSTAGDGGGYTFDGTYWWNPGLAQHYSGSEGYYLPRSTSDPFGATTTVAYDPYVLLMIQVTDPLGHSTTVEAIDYQALQPQKIRDLNQNYAELRFDPLGLVIASSIYGTSNGQPDGDGNLAAYQPQAAATLSEICKQPQTYLQMATSAFCYDLTAWMARGEPAYAVSLAREIHLHSPGGENSPIQITVAYSDGFGRLLQSKLKTENEITLDPLPLAPPDAAAPGCWLTTGKTLYNNKGAPVRQYEPFWSASGAYDDGAYGVFATYQYDALLREIRVDTPKGFFTKVAFTPWWQKHYDADDTVKDSEFYRKNIDNPALPPDERDALIKAAAFYNTPATQVFDNAGHPFLTIEDNLGALATSAFNAIVKGTPISSAALWNELNAKGYLDAQGFVTERFQPYWPGFMLSLDPAYAQFAGPLLDMLRQSCLTTYHQVDIEGLEWATIDPRLYYSNVTKQTQLYNFRYTYAMTGQPLKVDSADAGLRLTLSNALGQPIHSWDGRAFHVQISYNQLQLPLNIVIDHDGQDHFTAEELVYGADPNQNNVERLVVHRDQAGIVYFDSYNIQGQLLQNRRQLCQEYKAPVNWQAPAAPLLEAEVFSQAATYNALSWPTSATTPDGSVTTFRYYRPGWLQGMAVAFPDQPIQPLPKPFVQQIFYNARGDRQRAEYDNDVATDYAYEATTFRLTRIHSLRSTDRFVLQDIGYSYDPVGNVTRIEDSSYQTIFCRNQQVEPRCDYRYDALYRLISASGRQHPCIQQDTHSCGFKQSLYAALCPPAAHPNDMSQLERYAEQYSYDNSGNLVTTQHSARSASWSRVTVIAENSNRGVPQDSPRTTYDANGNLTSLENLRAIHWDYRDNLVQVDVIVRQPRPGNADCCAGGACCEDTDQSDRDYFVYDSGGNRVRKVAERYANGGQVLWIEEKIYLGNFEIKRITQQSARATTTILDRRSLRVMDDQSCVAISHYWLQDDRQRETDTPGKRTFRYQLDNNLGSSCIEVDAGGKLISYEEYFPYGGTALIAGDNQREVAQKDYRYSGKERDDSTGLYYYGARYYAPWLGRWMSPDPAGTVDGLNLYAFVGGNPVTHIDVGGMGKGNEEKKRVREGEESDVSEKEAALSTLSKRINIAPGNKSEVHVVAEPVDFVVQNGEDWVRLRDEHIATANRAPFIQVNFQDTYDFALTNESPAAPTLNYKHSNAGSFTKDPGKAKKKYTPGVSQQLDESSASDNKRADLVRGVQRVMKGTLNAKGFPKSLTESDQQLVLQMGTLLMTSEFYRGSTAAIVNSMAELDLIKYGESTFSKSFDTLNTESPYIGATGGGGAANLRAFHTKPGASKFQATKGRIMSALMMRIGKPDNEITVEDLNTRLNTRLQHFGMSNYFQ